MDKIVTKVNEIKLIGALKPFERETGIYWLSDENIVSISTTDNYIITLKKECFKKDKSIQVIQKMNGKKIDSYLFKIPINNIAICNKILSPPQENN